MNCIERDCVGKVSREIVAKLKKLGALDVQACGVYRHSSEDYLARLEFGSSPSAHRFCGLVGVEPWDFDFIVTALREGRFPFWETDFDGPGGRWFAEVGVVTGEGDVLTGGELEGCTLAPPACEFVVIEVPTGALEEINGRLRRAVEVKKGTACDPRPDRPAWLAPEVIDLARKALDNTDGALGALADALEKNGYDDICDLHEMRGPERHDCWGPWMVGRCLGSA